MKIDIEEKSKELKDFVARYETNLFLGDIGALIDFLPTIIPSLSGLSSPLRQLYYIAALNLTSPMSEEIELIPQFSDDDWDYIKKLLNEIEEGYDQIFQADDPSEVDEEWVMKRKAAMPTFLSYFNQGPMNFEEQIIERIERYFAKFADEIETNFALKIQDFIDIYNHIDKMQADFLQENFNPHAEGPDLGEFFERAIAEGLEPPFSKDQLPDKYKKLFGFMADKGSKNRFTKNQLIDKFGKEKTDAFLKNFVVERSATKFLYYTEVNPLHKKPLFKVGDDEYQIIEVKQLIHAIYNTIAHFCINIPGKEQKFYGDRGYLLEAKIKEIFNRFFKGHAHVHQSFYTQDGHEQDLMFLINGYAFIIEAKASKRDEPRRSPDMAYPLILENFQETIQKGYDQAYRVKSKFINKDVLKIYKHQNLTNHVIDIRTKNYHQAFSIIVTLENFGPIQNNLEQLLEIYEDDDYPWSVSIDDLETFLLMLEKQKKGASNLAQFLMLREKLHGRLVCNDELQICGGYITGKIKRQHFDGEGSLGLAPELADIFDVQYRRGLGFVNEKNMHIKKNHEKYLFMGGA